MKNFLIVLSMFGMWLNNSNSASKTHCSDLVGTEDAYYASTNTLIQSFDLFIPNAACQVEDEVESPKELDAKSYP